MVAAETAAKSLAPMTVLVRRTNSFMVSADRRCRRPAASDISVTETITETEIIDPALTETETMLIYETEIL